MKTDVSAHPVAHTGHELAVHPAYQAYQVLHWGFVVLPILAGVDKFFMKLTDWSQYLWQPAANLLGGAKTFMNAVGAIEIVAGFLVLFKPKIGAYVVALWLWAIVINLLLLRNYYDVALRDFGLSLGAIALARLAARFEKPMERA
jgi:uncharacterized membrane protein HdeD (DUF308 family)